MRTIAVLNQKGGVGKTTTVANTAAALAAMGSKVIAIDLDPQAHLTIHLGLEPQSIEAGSYAVLTQSAGFEEQMVQVRPNLWLLPANIDLVGAESELVSVVGRETILREAIRSSRNVFDYCLIDCAPSLGLLTLNALAAAEEVLIPLQPHFLALQGFGQLLQTVELVNRRINPDLRVKGVLLCMFDSRASLPNEVKADIEQFLENARGSNSAWSDACILPAYIRRNIKLAEAPSYGQTIFEYEPGCNGAEDYRKVAEFIHARFQLPPPIEALHAAVSGQAEDPVDSEQMPPEQMQSPEIDENLEPHVAPLETFPQPQSQEPPWQDTEPVQDNHPPVSPPFEIKPISPPHSHEPVEFTQNTTEQNPPETGHAGF
jgi:chromosome partitioning protein